MTESERLRVALDGVRKRGAAFGAMQEALKTLEWYADENNHEPELDGEAIAPDSSEVYRDNGRRARKALRAIRETL